MIRTVLSAICGVGALLVACGSHAAPPSDMFGHCPAFVRQGLALPRGANLFGAASITGQRLSSAAVTHNDAASVRTRGGVLAEVEPDDVTETGSVTSFSDEGDHGPMPVAVACRYGKYRQPYGAEAMLLIPLPANAGGECRYRNAKPPLPASMVCQRSD